ncbi:MAG: DNA polymerase IV [Syntrophothermus sp.]|uniref:DNA polymerase IV n=1 Tax=Syntrophothermus sp. TaxID=2736299 RepID=UPI00257A511D|nr:DNA polymerase IV [Syntrophothermus sp.]NSW82769.1 DNA polymerase IV [Syntrophothermus sp.]
MARSILLCDLNAFFASVHQSLEPELKGKPVIVTGDPDKRRGIVIAASYEAKKYGVKTGMLVSEAKGACPQGIFRVSDYPKYVQYSTRVLAIFREFTPLVEPFSIDEAFLDVTGCEKLFGPPVEIARKIKQQIREELDITCSIGIAPNKLLAKMAAELQKPDGLTVLTMEDVPTKLWPLPVRELFGVGPRYERHLKNMGITTIGTLARTSKEKLHRRFGMYGEILWYCANGIDHSPVDPNTLDEYKNMGNQITLPRDYVGEEVLVPLLELSEYVAARAREHGYKGRTVAITLRDSNLAFLRRVKTLPHYTDLAADIYEAAVYLWRKHWSPGWRVRMVGVGLGELRKEAPDQLQLFVDREKVRRLEEACDRINCRWGKGTIMRASSLTRAGVINEQ